MLKPNATDSRKNFYKLPSRSEWSTFIGRIRILQSDFFYFTEHRPTLSDGKTTFFAPCLGSPKDGHFGKEEEYVLDPEGVVRCRTIMVPIRRQDGTIEMVPLHDSDGGGETYFHILVWDWDTLSVKILAHGKDQSLAVSLYSLWVREGQRPLNELGDLCIQCSKQGNAWRYNVSLLSQPVGDIGKYMDVINAQINATGEGSIKADFNPFLSEEAIRQRLNSLIEALQIPVPAAISPGVKTVVNTLNVPGVTTDGSDGPAETPTPAQPKPGTDISALLNAPDMFESGNVPKTPTRIDVDSLPTVSPEEVTQGEEETTPSTENAAGNTASIDINNLLGDE